MMPSSGYLSRSRHSSSPRTRAVQRQNASRRLLSRSISDAKLLNLCPPAPCAP
nr:MAG TPA: hypothetical protein [Caudoviricetes sp.]